MKKIGMVMGLILFNFGASQLWADKFTDDNLDEPSASKPAPRSAPSENKFSFSLGPSLTIPASGNTASQYNVGGGVEAFVGYSINKNFMIGLEAGFQDDSVNTVYLAKTFQQTYGFALPSNVVLTGDFSYIPVMAMGKWSFGQNEKVKPYVLWGLGAAINQASISVNVSNQSVKITGNETSFLLASGLGLSLRASDDLEFFIQARLDIDFTSNSNSDIFTITATGASPVLGQGNLSDDSPTLFIPIQAGVRFL